MAKIKWNVATPEGFGGELTLSVNAAHTKAVFTDEVNHGQIVMFGENLKLKAGALDSGSVHKVVFKNDDGNEMIVATGGKYKASALAAAEETAGPLGIYEALFIGNDTVIGSNDNNTLGGLRGDDEIFGGKGMDILVGGKGDDKLRGGGGLDAFYFENTGVQHDIIFDLDVLGETTDQLEINAEVTKIRSIHNGDDTMLTLDNGSTILLKDVKRADFEDYWLPV
jgi:Ca2+-binding RTX toxin-like protein